MTNKTLKCGRPWLALGRRIGALSIMSLVSAGMVCGQEIAPSPPITFEPGARRVPEQRVVQPNFRQAELYNSDYLRQFVYDTAVSPNWIGKTDEFWYSYKTSQGVNYFRVNPEKGTKLPLFDQVKLASQLSELTKRPVESSQLNLSRIELDPETDVMKFVIGDKQYEFVFKTETLKELGPAPRGPAPGAGPARGGNRDDFQRMREEQQREEENQQTEQGEGRGNRVDRGLHRFWSPDRKSYVFARGHNLYYVDVPPEAILKDEPEAEKSEEASADAKSGQDNTNQDKVRDDQRREQGQGEGRRRGRGRGNNSGSQEQTEKEGESKSSEATKSSDKQDSKSDQQKSEKVNSEEGKSQGEQTQVEKKQSESGAKSEEKKNSQENSKEGGKEGGWPSLFRNQDQQDQKQDTEKQDTEKQDAKKQDDEKKQEDTKKQETEKQQGERQDDKKQGQGEQTTEVKQDSTKQEQTEKQTGGKEETTKQEQGKQETTKTEQGSGAQQAAATGNTPSSEELPIPRIDPKLDDTAIALTTDGTEEYSFAGRVGGAFGGGRRGGGGGGGGQGQQGEQATITETTLSRPNINWSKDSKSFYALRRDSRGVKELWVINSLAEPRPTLEKYPYPMPGEENIRKSELYYFTTASKKLQPVPRKWKDESYSDIQFNKAQDELRFLRRDRLLRNVAFCSLKLADGVETCLFEEGFEQANIAPQGLRYLENSDEVVWWSERSGWGHFYLYTSDGKLINQITSGNFLASRIVDIDEKNRLMYFMGSGREPNENVYYQHLYSVRLDGTGLRLLDPGDANHNSVLSPSKQFLVDNYSRVDLAPNSVLRRADGSKVMDLEQTDLSRLVQVGWRMPETFVVKAADGITDLYGNMYKPFDFDPNKRYPVITYVYPGPQQEGTRHTFTATAGEQQLAQIGFIVIQVGHRGGSPGRSKAYGSFGYFNLRDYGLADKKSAIEQLAQRYPFVDVERVGIYGHSGGGFMTAAALMLPPYNDFFKAGFSTAGNHDNNIYNNSWSERYHGLREVAVTESNTRGGESGNRGQQGDQQRQRSGEPNGRFPVGPDDFFHEFEMLNGEDAWEFDQRIWEGGGPLPPDASWQDDVKQEVQKTEGDKTKTSGQDKGDADKQEGTKKASQQQEGEKSKEDSKQGDKDNDAKKQDGDTKEGEKKDGDKKDGEGQDGEKKDGDKKDGEEKKDGEDKKSEEKKTKFEIRVPTNAELAANLKHHLFLVHGELDNNVHPANTLRLVDALIKANKRFDMLYLPATRHGFGQYQPYVTQRMFEFFAQRLLTDYESGVDQSPKQ